MSARRDMDNIAVAAALVIPRPFMTSSSAART